MNKTAEQPKSQNHAVKPAISSTLVSASATEGISLARSLNQKQFKRLTKAEFADKRSNGVCFRCDQKFTHGHRCTSPALQVVLVDKENKDDGVAEMAKVVEDLLHFNMGNARYIDVILGIKWLKTLGDVMVNWQLFTMTFGSETGKITLKGDPDLCPPSRVPAESMADKHRSDMDFKVGDLVFLKLYHYRQKIVAQKPNKKLAPNFYGPYRIINRISKLGYELKVPNAPNIRPLFHVSQLKRWATTAATACPSIPLVLTEDMAVMLTPEQLKGVRLGDMRHPETCKVLIKWKNYEATWESFSSFRKQFPEFHLEDKLAVWVGSMTCIIRIMTPIGFHRRKGTRRRSSQKASNQPARFDDSVVNLAGKKVGSDGEKGVLDSDSITRDKLVKESSIEGNLGEKITGEESGIEGGNDSNNDHHEQVKSNTVSDGLPVNDTEVNNNNTSYTTKPVSYARAVTNMDASLQNKLVFKPTGLNDSGKEVVIFDDDLVRIGSAKWQFGLKDVIVNTKGQCFFKFNNEEEAWCVEGLSAIASSIGKPIVMDSMIASMCSNGMGRFEYARVLVEIDAKKEFKEEIELQYRVKDVVNKRNNSTRNMAKMQNGPNNNKNQFVKKGSNGDMSKGMEGSKSNGNHMEKKVPPASKNDKGKANTNQFSVLEEEENDEVQELNMLKDRMHVDKYLNKKVYPSKEEMSLWTADMRIMSCFQKSLKVGDIYSYATAELEEIEWRLQEQ
nr:RNA-directed DNA polymerase [Tanacetum cinerariifolium]